MNEQTKRPIQKLRLSNFEKAIEIVSSGLILGAIVYVVFNWSIIPDRIPVHFGITGEVDRWGSKVSLIRVPILIMLFYSVLTILSRSPHHLNIPFNITEQNAELQYRNARLMVSCFKVEIVSLFAYFHYKAIYIAINNSGDIRGISIIGFLMIIFGTIGYFTIAMYKIDKKLKC